MASRSFFIALGIPDGSPENTARIESTIPLERTEHPLIHHLPQNY